MKHNTELLSALRELALPELAQALKAAGGAWSAGRPAHWKVACNWLYHSLLTMFIYIQKMNLQYLWNHDCSSSEKVVVETLRFEFHRQTSCPFTIPSPV